jgi:stearoyl-CoA desaturase (delta-9 desaturase)
MFYVHHVTWSVNSVCHTFGRRSFETADRSRNQWTVGLLALGEGWHNNHHAFPRSAIHGLDRWQFDASAWLIDGLERLGLARDVQRIAPDVIARKRLVLQRHLSRGSGTVLPLWRVGSDGNRGAGRA